MKSEEVSRRMNLSSVDDESEVGEAEVEMG